MEYVTIGLQYLVDTILYYLVFHNEFIKHDKRQTFWIKILIFSLINASILGGIYYFTDSSLSRLAFTVIPVMYLCLEERHIKNLNYIITYSCVINFILESINFLVFFVMSLFYYFMGILKTIDHNIFWSISLIIYAIIILIVYKFKFIKVDIIRKLSRLKFSSSALLILTFALAMVKYFYKQIKYLELCFVLAGVISSIIVILLCAYGVICIKIGNSNRTENTQLKKEIDNEIEQLVSYVGITPQEYIRQNKIFEDRLNLIKIDIASKGFSPMVLCLILIKNFKSTHVNLTQDIYSIVIKVLKSKVGNITKNMSNAIAKSIDTVGLEEFEKVCGIRVDAKNGCPSLKEFLISFTKHTDIH